MKKKYIIKGFIGILLSVVLIGSIYAAFVDTSQNPADMKSTVESRPLSTNLWNTFIYKVGPIFSNGNEVIINNKVILSNGGESSISTSSTDSPKTFATKDYIDSIFNSICSGNPIPPNYGADCTKDTYSTPCVDDFTFSTPPMQTCSCNHIGCTATTSICNCTIWGHIQCNGTCQ